MTTSYAAACAPQSEKRKFLVLLLGSVGVVYGDIGTSPLYAFRESLRPFTANGVEPDQVIGLISLMIWTLTIIVTFKYVLFLLRADNDGVADCGGCPHQRGKGRNPSQLQSGVWCRHNRRGKPEERSRPTDANDCASRGSLKTLGAIATGDRAILVIQMKSPTASPIATNASFKLQSDQRELFELTEMSTLFQ